MCTTVPEEIPPKTDHYPISITVDISPRRIDISLQPNFRATI